MSKSVATAPTFLECSIIELFLWKIAARIPNSREGPSWAAGIVLDADTQDNSLGVTRVTSNGSEVL